MRKLLVVLLCFMLGVSGCASKYGEQITTVKYYPDCYAPIAELRKSEKNVGNKVIGGAMVGALAGALIGAATTGRASGALAGAAIGAAAGGLTGYAAAKYEEHKDDKARYASYISDMDSDMEGATSVQLAANNARKCYEERFDEASREYKAKLISKEQFREKYTEIKNGLTETSRLLGKASQSLNEKQQQYYTALSEEAARSNQPVPQATKSYKPVSKPKKGKAAQPAVEAKPVSATLQGISDKNAQLAQKNEETVSAKVAIDNSVAMMDKNAMDLLGEGA